MRKVIFLDRDGVIIQEKGDYNYLPEHLEIVPGIEDFLLIQQSKGFEFITITNQGGIARGYYTHEHVRHMHALIHKHLSHAGVQFLDWFYCPHHDKVGYCLCRKPGSLMLEKAMARYGIDKSNAWFIGDKDSDVTAAENAGIQPIKIESNQNLYESQLNF